MNLIAEIKKMKTYEDDNVTLCDVHEEIIAQCFLLQEELDPAHCCYQTLYNGLECISKLAGRAMDMGQSMEDRMSEYYNAICSLGFERKHGV